jgi:hypothetical protein
VIDLQTRIVASAIALVLLLFIVELVRRRRLKEEYSVLWVTTAVVILVLAAWYQPLRWASHAVGAVADSSTLFFFGLVFAFLLLLHFSVRISALERQLTALVQEIGLLRVREPPDDQTPAEPSDRERLSA